MQKDSRILVIGHSDVIENSLFEHFQIQSYTHAVSASAIALDTTIQPSVYDYFQKNRPEYVFLGSVASGGIAANLKSPGDFIYKNCASQDNVIYAAQKFGVKKIMYFAGSCVYPKDCPQPIKEEYLLTSPLEQTSEAYSIARIAGIKLCQSYRKQYGLNAIVVIPATVYGPGSDSAIETAHVIGSLIGKFATAILKGENEVVVWGTGEPCREFIFTGDFVNACLFLMDKYNADEMVNVGWGADISIKALADMIKEISGFKGTITFDSTKPDGTMRKLMDNSRITKMGWKASVRLKEGVEKTYRWYWDIHHKKYQ